MACRNCGQDSAPGTEVCPECGADLTALHAAALGAAEDATKLSTRQEADTPPPVEPGSRRIVTVVAVLLGIVLLAACAIFGLNSVAQLRQAQQRRPKAAATVPERPVTLSGPSDQSDIETGPGEPDTGIGSGTPGGEGNTGGAVRTPESTIAEWYAALEARDAVRLKKTVIADRAAAVDALLRVSPSPTAYRITSAATSGTTSTILVEQTGATSTVVRYTLVRQANGVWLVASWK